MRSWWHFPAGSIRIRHRPKQEPTNLGLNTDPHPSTSSSSLLSSSSSFGFPSFPPQFQSLTHMFTPQTWHNLGLRSPGLLHTSLNEPPPLNDVVFAPLVNLYWLWLGLISHISALGHICLNQIHLFSWDPYYPCHLLANQSLKECSKVVPLFITNSLLV